MKGANKKGIEHGAWGMGHGVKNFKFAFQTPAALVGRASTRLSLSQAVPAKSSFCGSGFPAAIS